MYENVKCKFLIYILDTNILNYALYIIIFDWLPFYKFKAHTQLLNTALTFLYNWIIQITSECLQVIILINILIHYNCK